MPVDTLSLILISLIAYVIGSIPFGLVLAPLFKAGDIRSIGSGNIGATNALRTGKKTFALAVLLADGVKGAVAILVIRSLWGDTFPHAALIAGMIAVLGHLFPIWLKFKGGKGVATTLGVLLMLHWPTGLCVMAMWLVIARLSRYSSLAALIAALHAPIYAVATGGQAYALPFAVLAALIWFTHRANIVRLIKGEESVISKK
jgi:glycerol-3-phosphate acyltransferase PlsY